jgi:hypothetical protein
MRGALTLWLSGTALQAWRAPASGRPGGQRTYSDLAIESLAELLGLDLPIPDHTTLSRRLKKLENLRFRRFVTDEPIHLLIDSTGLRVHVGHLRRPPKRRVWRKLHLAVNADTGEVLMFRHGERRVPIPKHPGSEDEEPIPPQPTGRGQSRLQDPQHDDQPREARQLPGDVISAGDGGNLCAAQSHAPTPIRGSSLCWFSSTESGRYRLKLTRPTLEHA